MLEHRLFPGPAGPHLIPVLPSLETGAPAQGLGLYLGSEVSLGSDPGLCPGGLCCLCSTVFSAEPESPRGQAGTRGLPASLASPPGALRPASWTLCVCLGRKCRLSCHLA